MNLFVSRSLIPSLLLATVLCLYSSTSRAQDPAKDLDWAHAQFNKGLRENNKRNYAEGRRILSEVWPKYRTYDVASELSRAEGELGHHAAGAKYAAYAIAHAPPREGSEFKGIHTTRLELSLPHIYMAKLKASPADLTVLVDGVELDVPTDIGIYLEPGPHRLEFKKSGYITETKSIDAKANVQDTLVINLTKEASGTVIPPGNGREEPKTTHVTQPTPFVEPPPADRTLSWTILGVGSGLTAIAIGTGVYFHVQASDANDEAGKARDSLGSIGCSQQPTPTACQDLSSSLRDRDNDYLRAKVLYGVGAGLAVLTGAATWYFWPKASGSGAPTVSAWATPDSAGVVTFGRF